MKIDINNRINFFHNYLYNLKTFQFIFLITLFSFLILIPFIPILIFIILIVDNNLELNIIPEFSLNPIEIIYILLIAPLFETFIGQWIPIKLLRIINYFKEKNVIICIFSAIIFGLFHWHSFFWIVRNFFIGLLLAYAFILYEQKNESPFLVVASIHFLRNFITFIILIIESLFGFNL